MHHLWRRLEPASQEEVFLFLGQYHRLLDNTLRNLEGNQVDCLQHFSDKDLANALDTGHGVGSPLPLTAQVMEMLQTLRADGCGADDHSALAKFYAKL